MESASLPESGSGQTGFRRQVHKLRTAKCTCGAQNLRITYCLYMGACFQFQTMPIALNDQCYVANCAQTATLAINFLHIYKCTNSHLLHIMTNAFKHVKNCSNIGTGPQNIKTLGQITCDFSLFVYQTCCSRDEPLL